MRRPSHLASPEPGRILPLWKTPDGWSILQVHWSAVPDYQYAAACEGMGEEAIRRELDLDWLATVGKRVYPEFSRQMHVSPEPLEFDPELPLHCGHDPGGTPAFVVTQVNQWGQWCLLSCVTPPEDVSIGVYDFAQDCADHLLTKYARPYGLELEDLDLVHIGDPAGNQRLAQKPGAPRDTQTWYDVLDRGYKVYLGRDDRGEALYEELPGWGWRVESGAVGHKERQEAVRARLRRLIGDGIPALVTNPEPDGQIFIELFSGGYHIAQRRDGRYELDPAKNKYSHPANALEYVATRLDAQPPARDDDDGPMRDEWRSMASSRARG